MPAVPLPSNVMQTLLSNALLESKVGSNVVLVCQPHESCLGHCGSSCNGMSSLCCVPSTSIFRTSVCSFINCFSSPILLFSLLSLLQNLVLLECYLFFSPMSILYDLLFLYCNHVTFS